LLQARAVGESGKKLIAAAQYWAKGGESAEKKVSSDLAAFGLCTDDPVDEGLPGICPQNWQAVKVFVSLETQWNVSFSGHRVGIGYASIPPVLEMMGIERGEWPDLFESIRIMESAAMSAWERKK